MYLTEPDSWEKLEEDLGKIANHQTEVVSLITTAK